MRIVRLKIKNFRSVGAIDGNHAVNLEIDDNDLIFLCGSNNSGKSTILAAYEMFVIANRESEQHDFHGRDTNNHIEIEANIRAETEEDRNHRALALLWNNDGIAKIRKTWREVGDKGTKESFHPVQGWQEGGAGGFDTLLQNACPTPVWIRGNSTPEEVMNLLRTLVQETILKNVATEQVYTDAIAAIRLLDTAITHNDYATSLQRNLNAAITTIFPKISFTIRNDGTKDVIELFSRPCKIAQTINATRFADLSPICAFHCAQILTRKSRTKNDPRPRRTIARSSQRRL